LKVWVSQLIVPFVGPIHPKQHKRRAFVSKEGKGHEDKCFKQMKRYNFQMRPLSEHIKSLNFQDQKVTTFIPSSREEQMKKTLIKTNHPYQGTLLNDASKARS